MLFLSKETEMQLTAALAALANQLKELGADHGTIANLQQQIQQLGETQQQEINDAVKTAVAAAMANVTAPQQSTGAADEAAIASAVQTAVAAALQPVQSDISDLQTRVGDIETAIETGTGNPDQPAPAALAVSPTALSFTAGAAASASLSITGGTAPYSVSSSLADLSAALSDPSNPNVFNVTGTPAAAETGSLSITDSSSPAQNATVSVVVAAAAG